MTLRHYLMLLFVFLPTVQADEVVGRASVIDGDTVNVQGQRVRLYGIEAPARNQLCSDPKGRQWRCGDKAALAFFDHIGVRPIACEQKSRGRNNEIIAICYQGGKDINSWLVSNGWAKADRQASDLYVFEENEAKRARLNLWAGSIVETSKRPKRADRPSAQKKADAPQSTRSKMKTNVPVAVESARTIEPPAPTIKELPRKRSTTGALENFLFMPKVDVEQPRQDPEDSVRPAKRRCCVYCKEGRPCGDGCLSAGQVCQKPPGCAC